MITPSWSPTPRQLRQFALAAPVGFGLVGWMLARFGLQPWWPWAGAGFGGLLLAVGLARPLALRPLYALAVALATPIGWIASTLLMLVFYYLVVSPTGLLFRASGRDALQLRGGGSRWRPRTESRDPQSYYRQT